MKDHYLKYLNPTSTDQEWGVYVSVAGYSQQASFWSRTRIRNDFYFVLIRKGRGILVYDQTAPYEVNPGSCLLVRPGVSVQYEPDLNTGQEEYWIGFNGYYIRQLMEDLFHMKQPVLCGSRSEEIQELLIAIIEEARSAGVGHQQKIAGLVLQVLALIYAE